jgi:hypothetical protein
LRENFARSLWVSKKNDRQSRLIGNWHVDPILDYGGNTVVEGNQRVDPEWAGFPFAGLTGHDHSRTADTAIPDLS